MSRNIRINRGRNNGGPLVIIMLCAAVVFSAVIAGIWQSVSPPLTDNFTPVLPSEEPVAVQSSQPPVIQTSSAPQEPSKAESKPVQGESAGTPETEREKSTYFDDAVFIGDSLTTGITLYDVMSNTTVYASTGINLENVFTKPVVKLGEETVTIFDALNRKKPAKIYVMLGANSISQMDDSWILGQYDKLMKELKKQHPDAVIYIQSVLPINEPLFHEKYNKNLTNVKIDEMNQKLLQLTKDNGIYYLDLASVFKDENGGMPADATPDGLHIKSEQYIQWFDYLKTHTVQK